MVKKPKIKLKRAKRVKEILPEVVASRAASLNPLNNRPDEPPDLENVPKITNETIAEHREDVLKGARKYKYPLQHSKHRIIIISTVLLCVAVVGFFAYTGLS